MASLKLLIFLFICVFEGFCTKTEYPVLKAYDADENDIRRPCGAVFDVNCVREYFSKNAKCKKTYGPVPDPLPRSQLGFYLLKVNMTLLANNVRVGGVNGRIDEFYINQKSDNLVISIEFRNLTLKSTDIHVQYHRRGKEPVVTSAQGDLSYTSLLVTVVIPNIHDLQLDKAEFSTFLNEKFPAFFITPSVLESSDPQVPVMYAEFLANTPIDVQDLSLTDFAFPAANFIQYNICDFGLNLKVI